jgi:hypothetical protein
MAVNLVQLVANGASATNNTTATASITNVPTVGNHLILFARHQTNTVSLSTVSDGTSTWQIDHASATNLIACASCLVTADLTGVTFTLTWSGNTTAKIFWIYEFSGLAASAWFGSAVSNAVFFQGTSRNLGGSTVSPAAVGDLIVGAWAGTTIETSLTAGAGYTNLTGVTGSGYYNSSNSFIEGVWRAAASTSAQAPSATGGASPFGYSAFAATYKQATAAQYPPLVMAPPIGSEVIL